MVNEIGLNIITCDDILGKEVIDPEGEVLGIAIKLHIDKIKMEIVGITIDQGFMKPELYVGLEYIKKIGNSALFLKEVPLHKIKGMDVITEDGNYIGVVKDVVVENKKIKLIKVLEKKGIVPKLRELNNSDIKEIKASVILKKNTV